MLSKFFKNVQGSLVQFSQNLKTHFGNSQQNKLVETNNEILLRQANNILKKLKTSYGRVDHYSQKIGKLKKHSHRQSQGLINVTRPNEYLKLNQQIQRNELKFETNNYQRVSLEESFWGKFGLGLGLNYWTINSIERNFCKQGWAIYNEFLTKNFEGISRILKCKHYEQIDLMQIIAYINGENGAELQDKTRVGDINKIFPWQLAQKNGPDANERNEDRTFGQGDILIGRNFSDMSEIPLSDRPSRVPLHSCPEKPLSDFNSLTNLKKVTRLNNTQ
jgi:hypothetical protein